VQLPLGRFIASTFMIRLSVGAQSRRPWQWSRAEHWMAIMKTERKNDSY